MNDRAIAVSVIRSRVLARLVATSLAAAFILGSGVAQMREAVGKAPAGETAPDVSVQVLGQQQSAPRSAEGSLVNRGAGVVTPLTFVASSWQGGWLLNNSGFLGRP